MEFEVRNIAIDIEELGLTRKGVKVINAFVSSSAEIFKTKRGRLALLVKLETFNKLKTQLKINIVDGFDGLVNVILPVEPEPRKPLPV